MRTLNQVMLEGQEKTLEAMKLSEKQLAGTITAEETARLQLLNGNLLALAKEAVEKGFNPEAMVEATRARVEEELNPSYEDELDDYFEEHGEECCGGCDCNDEDEVYEDEDEDEDEDEVDSFFGYRF